MVWLIGWWIYKFLSFLSFLSLIIYKIIKHIHIYTYTDTRTWGEGGGLESHDYYYYWTRVREMHIHIKQGGMWVRGCVGGWVRGQSEETICINQEPHIYIPTNQPTVGV